MEANQGRRPRTSRARGGYAVGDERRTRILDAAVEHYAQWGFHASSLARIAKDVGVTQGGLLHHFRSKEDLLVSVLERSDEQDVERFFAAEPASAADCFRTLVDLAAHNAGRPGRVRMFNVLAAEAGSPGHPAHAYFERRYRDVLDHVSGALRRGVDSGELRPDTDGEQTAREIAAVMDGLQLQWALDTTGFDMAERLRAYLDRLLRVLAA
ncbi:TetR/AcrR family transcriptional regulator [Streptomyces sp. NPDC001941]|uniref:TetR/AcrR family transcriptional regulator n=1 Tax=Streptomyces sp. NPDC001941 TaxID=3154659 RepID=UPI00332B0EDF